MKVVGQIIFIYYCIDDINEIKRKLATQTKVINEFENYIGILLSVMKGSSQSHYSDLIRKVHSNNYLTYI